MVATTTKATNKQKQISVYLEEELKQKFNQLALADRRSMSQMAVVLIEEAVKKAEEEGKFPGESTS